MYLTRTPRFIQNLFPNFLWQQPTQEKKVYLTFDDGPIPEVTPWVLDQLDQFNAKATFFCVGDNVVKHPDVYQQVLLKGHQVGNHTFNHLNGWTSENINYFHNTRKCAQLVKSSLFRPPYGRLKPKQAQFLMRHYKVVMWSILSGDFDPTLDKEQCLKNVISNLFPGAILVFHDSLKAQKKLEYVLPRLLEYLVKEGYKLEIIEDKEASIPLKQELLVKRTA